MPALATLKYVGSNTGVWVPEIGEEVLKEGTIEVSEELASELLLAVGNWEPVGEPAEKLVPPPAPTPIVTSTVSYTIQSDVVQVLFMNPTEENLTVKIPAANLHKARQLNVSNIAVNVNTVTIISPEEDIRGPGEVPEAEMVLGLEGTYYSVTLLSDGIYWNVI